MKIVWDEPKRQFNLDKHRIDFANIDEEFFASAVIRPARDERFSAIGELGGIIAVIFAVLGTEAVSIISARPVSRKERELFRDPHTIHPG